MIELKYPELHVHVNGNCTMQYYVSAADNSGKYLAGDSYLKGLPWLFDSFDEAVLASAKYYHNNGWAYPWQSEMIEAGKRFLEKEADIEINTTVESTVMRFE